MTEAEWLVTDDVAAMLAFIYPRTIVSEVMLRRGRYSDRKLRLWVEACRAMARQQDRAWGNYDIEKDGLRAAVRRWCEWSPSVLLVNPLPARAALLRDLVGNPFRPVELPRGPTVVRCDSCGRENPTVAFAGMRCVGCGRGIARVHPGACPWLTPQVLSLVQAAYDERDHPCPYCKDADFATGDLGGPMMGGKEPYASRAKKYWRTKCACKGTRRVPTADGTLAPDRLAVLADALEEAGCPQEVSEQCSRCDGLGWYQDMGPNTFTFTCQDCDGVGRVSPVPHPLLTHLRSPGPHVRGCWAVDCLLGKE